MERKLLLNRWKTPDGTILTSRFTHDFVSHTDANGEDYFVDGGNDYIRMTSNKEPMEDLCVYSDSPFDEIRKVVTRGSFDKDGNRIFIPICNMSNKHLEACLTYNFDMGFGFDNHTMRLYAKELIYRFENRIYRLEREYEERDEEYYDDYTELTPDFLLPDYCPPEKNVEDFGVDFEEYIEWLLSEGYNSESICFINTLKEAIQKHETENNE